MEGSSETQTVSTGSATLLGVRASFVVVVMLLVAGMMGCMDLRQGELPPQTTEELPEQELFDATITFYQNDQVATVLQAGRIRKFQKQQTVLMDSGIVVDFFDETGQHTTKLWADSGRANERTRDLMASGNVVAVSDSGQRLETSVLRWEQKTRRIISDAPVKISTPSDTIYGTGFVSDQDLKNWTIERPEGVTFRRRQASSSALFPQVGSTARDSAARDSIQP